MHRLAIADGKAVDRWKQSPGCMPRRPEVRAGRGTSGLQRGARRAAPVGLAWYSMLGSYRLLRQMAQVSVQMAHDHLRHHSARPPGEGSAGSRARHQWHRSHARLGNRWLIDRTTVSRQSTTQTGAPVRRTHMATAFHFLISKRLPLALPLPFFSSCCCGSSTCSSLEIRRVCI